MGHFRDIFPANHWDYSNNPVFQANQLAGTSKPYLTANHVTTQKPKQQLQNNY